LFILLQFAQKFVNLGQLLEDGIYFFIH